jgi:hypothetical protein
MRASVVSSIVVMHNIRYRQTPNSGIVDIGRPLPTTNTRLGQRNECPFKYGTRKHSLSDGRDYKQVVLNSHSTRLEKKLSPLFIYIPELNKNITIEG